MNAQPGKLSTSCAQSLPSCFASTISSQALLSQKTPALHNMVKFRDIEICIISQFDICKLPEFKYPRSPTSNDPFEPNNLHKAPSPPLPPFPTASCYVPIYPSSQIWFEYTVDGPHPPGAAYFFKLIINGKVITSWDCTAKHGFHGKMVYNLVSEGIDPETECAVLKRQALRFGDGLEYNVRGRWDEDLILISVHRIEHRRRVRELEQGIGRVDVKSAKADGLRLTDSGVTEPGIRPRRYKYQLLDPIDMPYAAFQFHCRPYGNCLSQVHQSSDSRARRIPRTERCRTFT